MSLGHIYMEKHAQRSRRMNQAKHGLLIYFSDSQVKVIQDAQFIGNTNLLISIFQRLSNIVQIPQFLIDFLIGDTPVRKSLKDRDKQIRISDKL